MNRVSDGWSWAWVSIFVVIVFIGIAIGAVEKYEKEKDGSNVPPDRLRLTRNIAFSLAVLGIVGVFGTLWVVPYLQYPRSCFREPTDDFPKLDYRCDLQWDRAGSSITVWKEAKEGSVPGDVASRLFRNEGPQYFMCQTPGDGDPASRFGKESDYWALTQGDEDKGWGYVSELYFKDGLSEKRDKGLRDCTTEDEKYAGTKKSQKD